MFRTLIQADRQRASVVVEMMATAFGAKEHHITLCLRDDGDRLITNSNLKQRVMSKVDLRCVIDFFGRSEC
jgi:engulfment/cell motility protein 1